MHANEEPEAYPSLNTMVNPPVLTSDVQTAGQVLLED